MVHVYFYVNPVTIKGVGVFSNPRSPPPLWFFLANSKTAYTIKAQNFSLNIREGWRTV